MQCEYESQQFCGQSWFLTDGSRSISSKEDDPSISISICEHTTGEDHVYPKHIHVKGRMNIEAVLKACQYALKIDTSAVKSNDDFSDEEISFFSTVYLRILEHESVTVSQLCELLLSEEDRTSRAVQNLVERGMVKQEGDTIRAIHS